jgi:hypothetical protein
MWPAFRPLQELGWSWATQVLPGALVASTSTLFALDNANTHLATQGIASSVYLRAADIYGNALSSVPADGSFSVALYPVVSNFTVEAGLKLNLSLAEADLLQYSAKLQAAMKLAEDAAQLASVSQKVTLKVGAFDEEQQGFRWGPGCYGM